jgi:putative addiction module CopG family antidote
MNPPIPAEFQEFVDDIIRSGSFHSEAEVVSEALRLLRKREQLRREVHAGIEQLDRGEYTEYDEDSLPQFLADVQSRQREHFAKKSAGQ